MHQKKPEIDLKLDATLSMTKAELGFISDIDMHLFYERKR